MACLNPLSTGKIIKRAQAMRCGVPRASAVEPNLSRQIDSSFHTRVAIVMSRTVVNFLLDTILLTIVVALLFTSAVLRFVFPAPTIARGWRLWGHGYDAWANFQFMLLTV